MKRLIVLCAVTALAACQTDSGAKPVVKAVQVERPRQVSIHDDDLQSQIERKIHALDAKAFRSVNVMTWNGKVMLIGAVAKPEQRRKAEQATRSVESVGDVFNELTLAEDSMLDQYAPDDAKEEDLRRHLDITDKSGTALRVANGIAFILGGVETAEQAEALKADSADMDGIKWTVAHVIPSQP